MYIYTVVVISYTFCYSCCHVIQIIRMYILP